jgi:hypothetical protein
MPEFLPFSIGQTRLFCFTCLEVVDERNLVTFINKKDILSVTAKTERLVET